MHIVPFVALRPPASLAAEVASPPYDVVTDGEARALAERNPKSFIHVVRPEVDLDPDVDVHDPRVYAQGKEALESFVARGLLVEDAVPSLYLYRQELEGRAQVGVVACCHIDDYREGLIKRHELTRKAKEDDRTRHVLTLDANSGPVFLAIRDDATVKTLVEKEQERAPLYDFVDDVGVRHAMWKVEDSTALVERFAHVPCAYIADGHHRAAAAARAGMEKRANNPAHRGDEAYNHFLAVLFCASELKILPYHRVLSDLGGLSADDVMARLSDIGAVSRPDDAMVKDGPPRGAFDLYLDGAWTRVAFDPASIPDDPRAALDVSLVQERVLGPVFGIKDPREDPRIDFVGGVHGVKELKRRVDAGEAKAAISMHPVSVHELMAVSDAGEIMPPKSTWFEPKLKSGLLVHRI